MHMATYISRGFFLELAGFNIDYRDAGDFELFARALSKAPYETIAAPIACYRRTGLNNSAVNYERTQREVRTIRGAFGPNSRLERAFWRDLLKIWFNFGNPDWLWRKVFARLGVRLGLREKAYF